VFAPCISSFSFTAMKKNSLRSFAYLFIGILISGLLASFSPKPKFVDLENADCKIGGKINPEQITMLAATKTWFVLRQQDAEQFEAFKSAIENAWTFTKIEVILYDDYNNLELVEGEYSVFFITSYIDIERSDNVQKPDKEFGHMFLSLLLPKSELKGKKKKIIDKTLVFSRADLFPDPKFLFLAKSFEKSRPFYDAQKFYSSQANNIAIRNWTPGFLKIYLQDLQSNLKEEQLYGFYDQIKNKESMEVLKENTLYVPDYVLKKFNKFSNKETGEHSAADLFRHYPYEYKIISPEELSALILTDEKEVFFMDYTRLTTMQHMNIFSSKSGKIFKRYLSRVTHNITTGDIKRIFKK
jgi:hypothetical protein